MLAVQRVARDNAPAIKDQADHGAALGADAQVRLEAEAVDDGNQAVDAVERRAGDRAVGEDVAAAAREDVVYFHLRVDGARDGHGVQRFHETGGGHQERGVACAAGRGDDLAAAAEDGLVGKHDVGDFEFCVSDS